MMLSVRTVLNAPVWRVWDEARRPRLLDYVAWPLQVFEPIEPPVLPECGSNFERCHLPGPSRA